MKASIAMILAFICLTASADIADPQLPQLLSVSCGAPSYDWSQQQGSDGYTGAVRQRAHCNLSGRGARVRYYAACAHVNWTLDGYLVGDPALVWSVTATSPISRVCE